jgi:hypothetical protein
MLLRIKRHVEFLALFVLAGSFFLLLLRNRNREDSLDLPSSNDVNVTGGSHDGACQCFPCESQREPEVMDWDSSRVLRGSPTEWFRGMLSRQYLMRYEGFKSF